MYYSFHKHIKQQTVFNIDDNTKKFFLSTESAY